MVLPTGATKLLTVARNEHGEIFGPSREVSDDRSEFVASWRDVVAAVVCSSGSAAVWPPLGGKGAISAFIDAKNLSMPAITAVVVERGGAQVLFGHESGSVTLVGRVEGEWKS